MIANYHTHTWRCKHASGAEREYVENAIAGGLKILGFSDHTPMPYPGGYVSRVRMDQDQLEGYADTVLRLKEEYKKDIEIHLGLEAEYYPAYFEEMLRWIGAYPIEYLLLGQHYIGNEINESYSGTRTEDETVLERYCRQSQEALETGSFTYFAHPDLLNYVGDPAVYEKHMSELCRCAKRLDIPLEINFLGISSQRNYPNPEFWKLAGRIGNRVIFGADAHEAAAVSNPTALQAAERMAEKYQLQIVDTVTLRSPFH